MRSDRLYAYALATVGPVAYVVALIPLRTVVGNEAVAITMILWVLAAAILGGRGPSISAALVSTAAFIFVHTEPYYRPVIDDVEDVEVAVVYLTVGLLVGEIATQALVSRGRARWRGYELARIYRVAHQIADGLDGSDITRSVCAELSDELSLVSCRFERGDLDPLPARVDEQGAVIVNGQRRVGRSVRLPHQPFELLVARDGRVLGRLVLEAESPGRIASERLVIAVTLADLLALALTHRSDATRRS